MTASLYDPGREGILDRTIDVTAGTVKAGLVRSGTFSASHKFLSDLTGAGATLVASFALASKTYTGGVLDAADGLFPTVAAGAACNALVLYNDTGTPSTSRLIGYEDSATGLPVTPNGTDIPVTWDNGANKILKL
jgi:hypothetical protein